MQFTELTPWLPGFNINYSIGVDGISVALIMLTTFTSVLVLLGSWSRSKPVRTSTSPPCWYLKV